MLIKFQSEEITPKKLTYEQFMCPHNKIIADEAYRSLKCDICGVMLDPFEYLLLKAKKQHALCFRINELQKEQKRLMLEITDLKRRKKNLKSSIKSG